MVFNWIALHYTTLQFTWYNRRECDLIGRTTTKTTKWQWYDELRREYFEEAALLLRFRKCSSYFKRKDENFYLFEEKKEESMAFLRVDFNAERPSYTFKEKWRMANKQNLRAKVKMNYVHIQKINGFFFHYNFSFIG